MKTHVIAVIGGGREADPAVLQTARDVGRLVAERKALLVTGGLGGIMEAASRGAAEAGGTVLGILPGHDREEMNPWVTVPVVTGFGTGRNVIIARTADAMIAVSGEYGTLSEIAHGLQMGKPVVGIGTWDIPGVVSAASAPEAVDKAFSLSVGRQD